MERALKECFIDGRDVTILGTLSAEAERLSFYWRIFMWEFTKPARIMLAKGW